MTLLAIFEMPKYILKLAWQVLILRNLRIKSKNFKGMGLKKITNSQKHHS